ncbi:DUF4126 family protein [Mucilaginibacter sp. RCC_168]|uniref:DUF4126 family protein n=1 Tax=Mucilaginibacter sp. RCC_168 TaxID=3239221 RepID=UPI0035243C43
MKLKISNPLWQVIGLGTLAGMRTSSAPVIASHILSHHQSKSLEQSNFKFMQSTGVANTLKVMALSELAVDKLPVTPNRIKPFSVLARSLSGALAGASIYKATGNNAFIGAVIGGSAALVSTFGSFYLRKSVVKASHLVDPIVGAIEDALVIGSGVGLSMSA